VPSRAAGAVATDRPLFARPFPRGRGRRATGGQPGSREQLTGRRTERRPGEASRNRVGITRVAASATAGARTFTTRTAIAASDSIGRPGTDLTESMWLRRRGGLDGAAAVFKLVDVSDAGERRPRPIRPRRPPSPALPPSTTTGTVLLPFTSEVPSCPGSCRLRQAQFPLTGGRLRGYAPTQLTRSRERLGLALSPAQRTGLVSRIPRR